MTASCPKKPNIAEISPHLICALCGGYLIDATTIVECLHSFCKTCIVRYLESSKYCPICEVLVHKTRPLQNIRLDHTLQDIVYKLVPGLFQTEMQRRRDFYKDSPTIRSAKTRQEQQRHRVIYSADEKFSLALEFCPEGKIRKRSARRSRSSSRSSPREAPDRRYFLCPASATIALLKKFIKLKFTLPDKYKVELFHVQGGLLDHFSLMDVAYMYSWRREGVLHLYYSIYKDPDPVPKIEITELAQAEVKQEDHEDNRPSSLFTKAKLLGNHSVDGNIPHNLSPLELIATVANDISIQEGRGLKRKAEEAQLYEQEDDNSDEIQIQKSIEHAIDICSNNTTTVECKSTATVTTQDHTKSAAKSSFSFSSLETPHIHTKPPSSAILTDTVVHTKVKTKDKPKTTDTASQCDPRPKKHKTEASNAAPPHSRSPAKSSKPDISVKDSARDDATHSSDKAKSKDELNKTKSKDELNKTKSKDEPNRTKSKDENTKAKSKDEPNKAKSKDEPNKAKSKDEPNKAKSKDEPNKAKSKDEPNKAKSKDEPIKTKSKDEPTKVKSKDEIVKVKSKDEPNRGKSKDDLITKPERVTLKTNGNNNVDLATIVTKPQEKNAKDTNKTIKDNKLARDNRLVKDSRIIRDNNANQTIVTGRTIQESVERAALAIAAQQKANAAKSEPASTLAQINGMTSTIDVAKQHINHTNAK